MTISNARQISSVVPRVRLGPKCSFATSDEVQELLKRERKRVEHKRQREARRYRQMYDMYVDSQKKELGSLVAKSVTINASGAQIVYEMLVNRGIKVAFGYSGGAVLPLIDQFIQPPSHLHAEDHIRFLTSANEACAAHAAQATAKATGIPGVCVVTSGPGLTNVVTPLQDALMDGNPIVVLSGQVATTSLGTDAFQECHATDLTRACTKWNFLVKDVECIPWTLDHAFKIATSGRPGPVHIDLPKNILASPGAVPLEYILPERPPSPTAPDFAKLPLVANLLNNANRPLLHVGHGAINASHWVHALSAKGGIPVTSTLHGMGVFNELDAQSLHMAGMHGSAYANYAIQNADVIIAIGARFDDRTTGDPKRFAPAARLAGEEGRGGIVHFDIDPTQFHKAIPANMTLAGDCGFYLEHLLPLLEAADRTDWREQVSQWKRNFPFSWTPTSDGRLKIQQVVQCLYNVLSSVCTKEVTVCTGVGNHQMMTAQFFRWTRPRQLVTSGGLGTMGTGLPFAVGTQIALPDNFVLLIDGDSSFNMSLVDLQSVAKYNLPIKIAIMNDGRQQMVHAWQELFYKSRFIATDNVNPDYCKIAQAYGIETMRVTETEGLEDNIKKFLTAPGSILADFRVVPDFCLPMVPPGKALDEMLLNDSSLTPLSGSAPS